MAKRDNDPDFLMCFRHLPVNIESDNGYSHPKRALFTEINPLYQVMMGKKNQSPICFLGSFIYFVCFM